MLLPTSKGLARLRHLQNFHLQSKHSIYFHVSYSLHQYKHLIELSLLRRNYSRVRVFVAHAVFLVYPADLTCPDPIPYT